MVDSFSAKAAGVPDERVVCEPMSPFIEAILILREPGVSGCNVPDYWENRVRTGVVLDSRAEAA
jgi:hypothetical protein